MTDPYINLGAQIRAVGNAVGMSEDQVIQMVIGAQRKGGRQLGRTIGTEEAENAVLSRLGKVAQVNEAMPGDIDDYRSIPNDQVVIGEEGNQDRLQNFGGRNDQGGIKNVEEQLKEMAGAEGRVDPNVIKKSTWDNVRKEFVTEEFYAADGVKIPQAFQEAAKQKDFGLQVPNQLAPAQQVLREELGRLQEGIDKYGADAFPGGVDPQRGISRDIPGVLGNEFVDPLLPGIAGPNAPGARLGEAYIGQIPGAAGVAGEIEDELYGKKGAEQALAREMVARDKSGFASDEIRRRADLQLRDEFGGDQPMKAGGARAMPIDAYQVREQQILNDLGGIRQNAEAVEANDWRAQAEANVIGQDFQEGGRGARADQAMDNIRNIAKLGPAKEGSFELQYNRGPEDTTIPNALEINLPDQYNAPATDNRFVGPLQKQEQWLVDNAPGYKQVGKPGIYPQIDIGGQFANAQAGIEGINFRGQNVDLGTRGIRNLDDLQGAVDQAIGLGREQGVRFFNFQDGKNQFVENPGINEVLQKAGMNQNQQNDLARAMFAAEGARRNPANAGNKARFEKGKEQVRDQNMGGRRLVNIQGPDGKEYRVVRDANKVIDFGGNAPEVGGGMVDIARLGAEKIEGKEVRGQLQALDGRRGNDTPLNKGELADARMPLIGGVAGNDIPRAAFVRGNAVNMTDGQRIEEYGPINGEIANRVVRRFNEAGGYDGKSTPRLVERQRNEDPGPARQMATDPWTAPMGTGPGFTQVGNRTSAPKPQLALPYGTQTSGDKQGPVTSRGYQGRQAVKDIYGSEAKNKYAPFDIDEDPTINPSPRRVRQEANILRNRRYGRNAAIAGGAVAGLAGLDSLIGGERNKREEAQY